MLAIRFARVGKKNKAQYKIVLQEKAVAPGGRHVEILGSHDPHLKNTVIKEDRIKYWLEKGAQASDTVHNLLVTKGVITDKKRAVKIPAKKVEEVSADAKAVADKPADAEVVKEDVKAEPASAEATAGEEVAKSEEVVAEAPKEEAKAEEKKEEIKAEEVK